MTQELEKINTAPGKNIVRFLPKDSIEYWNIEFTENKDQFILSNFDESKSIFLTIVSFEYLQIHYFKNENNEPDINSMSHIVRAEILKNNKITFKNFLNIRSLKFYWSLAIDLCNEGNFIDLKMDTI